MKWAVLASLTIACGPSSGGSADASGEHYGLKPIDAGIVDVGVEAPVKTPDDRMTAHEGIVLSAPHIRAIYIGQLGAGGSQPFDAYLQWLVTSTDYWGAILAQYGVGYGTYDGASYVDIDAFFTPGMLTDNMLSWTQLDLRVVQLLHPSPSDAGAPSDGGADGGDAQAMLPSIPPADGYIFFLPDNVTVDLGDNEMTCVQADGYHSFDGVEPYAVIPDCGRNDLAVSHEMAEMCTDPQPGGGWFSDADIQNAGGEVGDLCNFVIQVDSHYATALWSNQDGDCEPP